MKNEKTVAANDGIKNFNEQYDFIPRSEKIQLVFNFGTPPKITHTYGRKSTRHAFNLRQVVCDQCCAPLYIYSETFVAAYLDPRAELPPSLCDLHLSELEAELQK